MNHSHFPALILLITLMGCNGPQPGSKPHRQRLITSNFEISLKDVRVNDQPPAPSYPQLAKTAGIQGDIVLEVLIDADGVPISAKAINGPQQLRPTAENYLMRWRFHPVIREGKPQITLFNFIMPFRLK